MKKIPDRKKNSWYSVRRLAPGLWAIDEKTWDRCYLIAGEKRALLIDTTWGMADLASTIRSLTGLPIEVVLTHGHSDHVCGARYFPSALISRQDMGLFKSNYTGPTRMKYAKQFRDCLTGNAIVPSRWARMSPRIGTIHDGQRFDLGGTVLRAIAIPGHTPGSVCFHEPEKGYLFTGDSVLEGSILLDLSHSTDLKTYLSSLERLKKKTGGTRLILPGHNRTPLPATTLDNLIKGTAAIISGKTKCRLSRGKDYCETRIARSILRHPLPDNR